MSKLSGDGQAKNPRLVLGKGPNGTELYVKIEKENIEGQFAEGSGSK